MALLVTVVVFGRKRRAVEMRGRDGQSRNGKAKQSIGAL